MKLFNSGSFQLEYLVGHDILCMRLPDMKTNGLSEAEYYFGMLVENIKNYHIANLLLDSRNAMVGVSNEEYNALIYKVSMELKQTRLKKIARLRSNIHELGKKAGAVQEKVLNTFPECYEIRNFSDREDALDWLTNMVTA